MSRSPERHGQDLPLPRRITPLAVALQKYNADYDLSATQGADTLAFVSLLEEKLLPVLVGPPTETSRGGGGRHGEGGLAGDWMRAPERCRRAQACARLPGAPGNLAAKSQGPGAGIRVLRGSGGVVQPGLGAGLAPDAPSAPCGAAGSLPGTRHRAQAPRRRPRQKAALAPAPPWPGHGLFSAADPHLLGGRKELRGAHAEVVRGNHSLPPELLPAQLHAQAAPGAAAALVGRRLHGG